MSVRNSSALRNIASCPASSFVLALLSALSCAKHSDAPPAYPPAQAPPAPVTPPGSANGTTPVLAASPNAAGTPGAALSTPNPLALPCTADAHCLTHRCNVAAQKCAWPCQTDADCMPGNACITPTCLPKLQ